MKDKNAIVQSFNSKWRYRKDKHQYGMRDAWKIIYSTNAEGKYEGDCEDYALSILYRLAGESHLKFGPKYEIERNYRFHIFYGYGWAYMTALKMIISKVVRTLKK